MKKRDKNKTKEASEAYRETLQSIRQRMTEIKGLLNQHNERANQKPKFWTFQGDLSYVLGELDGVRNFLAEEAQ